MLKGPTAALTGALGAALLLAATAAGIAQIQTAGVPADIASKLAEIGPVINPPATAKLYVPLHEKEPYKGVKVVRDVKFGPDERQALDVFVSETPSAGPRPVLIYVHGGGFVGGARRGPGGSPFYDNIVLFAARNGMVGVNTTYRLAPKHTFPAGAEDIGAAVRWVGENIAGYGGDPKRVFLMGNSAGTVHVATYVAHERLHGPKGLGLAGAILVSGIYDLTARPAGKNEKAYFGEDASKYAERSSLAGLLEAQIPLMTVYAELDPPRFQEEAKRLNAALAKAGKAPRTVFLAKHNHISQVYAINTADTSLSGEVLAFVQSVK